MEPAQVRQSGSDHEAEPFAVGVSRPSSGPHVDPAVVVVGATELLQAGDQTAGDVASVEVLLVDRQVLRAALA